MPARFVLYLLSWSGFLVSFMMRTDINLAIVAMVEDPKQVEVENHTNKYCFVTEYNENEPTQVVVRNVPNYFFAEPTLVHETISSKNARLLRNKCKF